MKLKKKKFNETFNIFLLMGILISEIFLFKKLTKQTNKIKQKQNQWLTDRHNLRHRIYQVQWQSCWAMGW